MVDTGTDGAAGAVDARRTFEEAVAAWHLALAKATVAWPSEVDRAVRETVTAQVEDLHRKAIRWSDGHGRIVTTVRVEFLDPPLAGAGLTVGLTHALRGPLEPVRLFHGRTAAPEGRPLLAGPAAEAFDLVFAGAVARRRLDADVRARFERWASGRAGALDFDGLAAAVPEVAPHLRAILATDGIRH